MYNDALEKIIRQYEARLQHLVNYMDEQGLLDDHRFTFPDGFTRTSSAARVIRPLASANTGVSQPPLLLQVEGEKP